MKNYKVILFDLDGTLTDPKEGITKSVEYALKRMGIDEPNLDNLECFIGPPLHVSFAEYYGFSEAEISKATALYRERFKEKGMYENVPYDGIQKLLAELQQQGYRLAVATSKPTVFAKTIVDYFQIGQYFEHIVGSNLDGTRSAKAEIIQYIIAEYGEYDLNDFIMIGDRKHDLIGANQVGIDAMGVTYGYGDIEELQACNPTYIANTVEQVGEILLRNQQQLLLR
ncbi:HAD family hydrolase [Metabacillus malikii]|uniref:Phosphoglycolate phosphatase n=1 Tax=Metabacillus malikii TaxID=1504265 RepID=A0ABT9ZJR2_9BACI|nr:HAD family hydrolase [Metabacillus malikii]MDQ0232026.1 phosphoglycolate phosphatase [Metabacillus malikii]